MKWPQSSHYGVLAPLQCDSSSCFHEVASLFALEVGVGHVTCFGQWEIGRCEASRGLYSVCAMGPARPCCYGEPSITINTNLGYLLDDDRCMAITAADTRPTARYMRPFWTIISSSASPAQKNCPVNPQTVRNNTFVVLNHKVLGLLIIYKSCLTQRASCSGRLNLCGYLHSLAKS